MRRRRAPITLAGRGWGRGCGGVAIAAAALAACQTKAPLDYSEFRASRDAFTVAAHVSDNVKACWFGGARPAFAGYSYAPELTSYSNRPRILIVPKHDPAGLPKLVIEASASGRETSVKLFGPLMASPEAPAIRRDVERWAGGAAGC